MARSGALRAERTTPAGVRVTWHGTRGTVEGTVEILDTDYLYLTPPAARAVGAGR